MIPRIAGRAGLVLTVALAAAFLLLPLAGLIDRGLREGATWNLITSGAARDALILSLWTSTLTVALAITFGTPVAYLLARARFRGHQAVDALVDLPILLPPTVAGVALLTAFGRRGIVGEPIEQLTGLTLGFTTIAVIMAQLFVAAPFYIRTARGGFAAVDEEYEQVAFTLGAPRARAFFRIVLPLAWPSVIGGAVLCWARALGELGATLIFAGSIQGETRTLPLAILNALETTGLAGAVALSLLLLAMGFISLLALRLVAARIEASP
jgi:molybdate transport system permease protein